MFLLKVIETIPVFGGWILHGLHVLLLLCIPHPLLGRGEFLSNSCLLSVSLSLETDGSSSAGLWFLLKFHHLMPGQYICLGDLLSCTPQ